MELVVFLWYFLIAFFILVMAFSSRWQIDDKEEEYDVNRLWRKWLFLVALEILLLCIFAETVLMLLFSLL